MKKDKVMINYDVFKYIELENLAEILVVRDKLNHKYISMCENIYDNWRDAVDDNIEWLKQEVDA